MHHYRRSNFATATAVVISLISVLSRNADAVRDASSTKLKALAVHQRGGGAAIAVEKPILNIFDMALAGGLATMIGDAALHPVDCLKTLQQSNEGAGLSLLGAGKQIYKTSGIGGFYSGLGTYVISDGGAGCIKFATYEYLKQLVNERVDEDKVGTALFGCAALAFVASSVVLVPGELVKQRLQMGQYATLKEAVSTIWKTEGLFGFYTGYAGVCLRDIPYTMFELGLYDNFKSLYLKLKNRNLNPEDGPATTTQTDEIIAAGITGGICGYFSNPLDLIKTKLMVDGDLYKGFMDCFAKTVQEGGASSLFQGGVARVAWLMPFTAVYLPVYDLFKRRIELYKTKLAATTALKVKGGGAQQQIASLSEQQQQQPQRNDRHRLYRFEQHPLHQTRAFISF